MVWGRSKVKANKNMQNKMEAKMEIKRLKGQIKKCKGDLSYKLTDNERKDIMEYMHECIERKTKIEEKYFPVSIPSWIFHYF